MTTPRQPGVSTHSLDDLLSRLPTPGGEPSNSEWAARLERTLTQLQSQQRQARSAPDHGEHEASLLLRTPLPLESGEPEPATPFSFDTVREGTFDELRAPLKSGEQLPLRELEAPLSTAGVPATSRQRRVYWLSCGAGILAAAAAFALYLGKPTQSSEVVHAASSEANVTPQEPAPNSAANVAQASATEPVEVALEQTAATPTRKAGGSPVAHAAAAAAKASKSPADEEPLAPAEPALTPAAGPSNLIDHPSVGALNAAFAAAVPTAQRCLSATVPEVNARVTFKADGSVQRVQVSGANLTDNVRVCVAQAFARSRVEPFARSQFEVTRTVSMPKR